VGARRAAGDRNRSAATIRTDVAPPERTERPGRRRLGGIAAPLRVDENGTARNDRERADADRDEKKP
jgi:hypothetical protein